ncbi:MAG: tRNA (N(6)-L-threonylcarbamoyladenosine(37)-C(2))-methylthiotransferase MtaB [Eubacteriales bacterium]|nr:tRNA (N(6)-L-threonylcarbamoyladenosine(37)-C(2))-methylthiotransferase MtaB [Eubacteriales bacterium]
MAFYTLGCKVNAYDSAYMQELFLKNGYTPVGFGAPADIVVINTCTVTATADKKSRAAIRRAAAAGSKVIVAGCMAQKQAKELLEMDGVCAVVGTDDRAKIADVAERLLQGQVCIDMVHDIAGCAYEDMHVGTTGDKTRAIVKIQEGCDNFCSYCIIPYVRGRSRSRRMSGILDEAKTLADTGAKEIVLTGIHIASYADNGHLLGDVVCALDEIAGIRIRLGSIEPGVLGEDFIRQVSSAQSICPHFHLSLQSGSASVLKRMNRKYSPEEYMNFVNLLRLYFNRPAITTDIIAGFPGETPYEHNETMKFVEQAGFSRIHVFPFSAREGTKACNIFPKVPKRVAKERASALIRLGDEYEMKYINAMIGRKAQVLFEDASDAFKGCLEGYSERYIRVAAHAKSNELKTVTIARVCDKIAFGS